MLKRFISKIKAFLTSSSFGNNVILLAGGTAIGQIFTIAISPVITRIYSPNDIGVFSLFSSVFSILLTVISFRYELAIPLSEDDDDALCLLGLTFQIVILSSICIGVFVWTDISFLQLRFFEGIRAYLWLIPFGLLGAGIFQILNYWALRMKAFDAIAKTKLTQSLTSNIFQVTVGILSAGPLGLIIGQMVGQTSGAGTLFKLLYKSSFNLKKVMSPKITKVIAIKYRSYPIYITWSSLLNTISGQIPVLLLSGMFGSLVVGWFALSVRVLQTPISFIGQAISQVFYAQLRETKREGILKVTVENMTRKLILLGLSPCLILVISGPILFQLIFGDKWTNAGLFSRWLAPWLFVVFVASPLSNLVFLLGRQRQEFIFQISLFIGRIASLVSGWYFGNPYLAIIFFSCTSTLLWLGYLFWLLNISQVGFIKLIRYVYSDCIKILPITLPILVVVVIRASAFFTMITIVFCLCGTGWRSYKQLREV